MVVTTVYTIGHSSHSAEHFIGLLQQHRIRCLVDVRSAPWSRRFPHFSRRPLAALLGAHGIAYEYRGDALGGRPAGSQWYREDGGLDHPLRAAAPDLVAAAAEVGGLARSCRVALMCAEEDPAHCHRQRLLGPAFAGARVHLAHVRGDGRLEYPLPDLFS